MPGPDPTCGAVAFRPPGQLLVSGLDWDWSRIWTLDFDGNILAGPSDSVLGGLEGLVSLPDGHVLGIGTGGAVRWLGADLVWLPERDRIYRPTEGLGQAPAGVAWDSTKGAFVLSSRPMDTSSIYALYNLPEGFGGVSHLVDLWPRPSVPYYFSRRLTFLPDTDLIATAQPRRRNPADPQFVPESIQFFSGFDGTYGGQIDLSGLLLGTPQGIAYLSRAGLFAMSFLAYEEPYEAGKVYLFSRDGDWIRAIDYSATITNPVTALTESASENELLITDSYSLFVADLDGNVTQQFSVADIQGFESRVQDLATVTTGKYEGAFVAITYGSPAKLTIFEIRGKGNK
jgi:hypothetical protein